MKATLGLLFCFILGIGVGYWQLLPQAMLEGDHVFYLLCLLLLFVGIGIGIDTKTLRSMAQSQWQAMVIPFAVGLGSLLGSGLVGWILPGIGFNDGVAVGAGFGYYSLSSILLTQLRGETLGVIALLSNIMRELLTIFFTPYMVRFFGPLAPIASGGATSMDTTLPIIHKYVGTKMTVVAVLNGIVLSMAVPFLIPFLAG